MVVLTIWDREPENNLMLNKAYNIENDHCIPCLKSAKIIVTETQSTFRCTIRNLCFLTAKLELDHYIELPKVFLLSMSSVDYAAPIKCKIRIREGNNVIVTFI